jgi:hypothetical protein
LSEQAIAEASSFLRAELRHHVMETPPPGIPAQLLEWVEQTRTALAELARGATQVTLDRLDTVRASFDSCGEALRDHAAEAREAMTRVTLAAREARIRSLEEALGSHLANHEAERARLEGECMNAASRIVALGQHAAAIEEALGSRIAALEQSRTWRWTAPLRAAIDFSRGVRSRGSDRA